jgi:hypothetical protein
MDFIIMTFVFAGGIFLIFQLILKLIDVFLNKRFGGDRNV